jgi:hypothetical protein
MKRAYSVVNISLAFFCLIILAGCSITETVKKESDEDVLRGRVMAYCNNKIKGEVEKNYDYEDPLYRKTASLSTYIRNFSGGGVKWLAADIKNIEMQNDRATVDLKVRLKTVLAGQAPVAPTVIERDSEVRELWIKIDGEWFHTLKAKGLR